VIEKALKESKCVVVMWSKRSVESQYVKHEANYALKRNKLVPIMIEEVELPFRFEDLHTLSLLDWDGSKDISEFRRLVEDIAAIVGPPATTRQKTQRAESEVGRGTISRDEPKGDSTRLSGVEQPKRKLEPGPVFRDKLKDGSQGPEMVVIPAGTFQMGHIQWKGYISFQGYNAYNTDEPVHTVRLGKPFAIGCYPITFDEYDQFTWATGRPLPNDRGWAEAGNRRSTYRGMTPWNTPSGCQNKLASVIVCRQRPSESTRHGAERRLSIGGVTR
jgi:formylglycine-generating enzyme required for sulfatase activity